MKIPTPIAPTTFKAARRLFADKGYTRHLWAIAACSMGVNFLILVPSVYMLQVYDRILTSASLDTHIVLTVGASLLLIIYGFLDGWRQRKMGNIGLWIHRDLLDKLLSITFRNNVLRSEPLPGQPIRDLDVVRQFVASPAALTFFDFLFVPLFIAVIFYLHFWLGVLAFVAAVVIGALAFITDIISKAPQHSAAEHNKQAQGFMDSSMRGAETLSAMGMFDGFRRRFHDIHTLAVAYQARGGANMNGLLAFSKAFRQFIQVSMLALGALLVLRLEISAGTMIAASIILGRALAPIEQGLTAWRSFIAARAALNRLDDVLSESNSEPSSPTELPRPNGLITVEGITVVPPGGDKPTLQNISFLLQPGSTTGIVGPNGSGKTTLVRALLGIWPVEKGKVSLDNTAITEWSEASRFQHIAYVPQEASLFPGTIAQNIGRMGEPDDEAVIAAAQLAGCDELIRALPNNYGMSLATGGANLSAGMRQRIALARAVFGDTSFMVLDEPDVALDHAGRAKLTEMLSELKARSVTVVLVTHTISLLNEVDNVIAIQNGEIVANGPRDIVLAKLTQRDAE